MLDLADLEAAEGKCQVIAVQCYILGQGYGQVKAQGQVAVALGEAVDLLLGLAAALGQEDLGGLDDGGVQGGEAGQGVGTASALQHPVELGLPGGEQFHKAGQGAGLYFCHSIRLVVVDKLAFEEIKTKNMVSALNNLKVTGKTLVMLPEKNENVQKSARNIEGVKTTLVNTINVYDLLKYKKLVLTVDTIKKLEEVYA